MAPSSVSGGVGGGAPTSDGVARPNPADERQGNHPRVARTGEAPAGAAAASTLDGAEDAGGPAGAPFTSLLVWKEPSVVICALCDMTLGRGPQQLKHHVSSSTHKAAVTAATAAGRTNAVAMVPPAPHAAVAVSTADECVSALEAAATPSQVATLDRYKNDAKSWPSSADAPHLPPVPASSARHNTVVCYQCRSVGGSSRELLRKHAAVPAADAQAATNSNSEPQPPPPPPLSAACSNRVFPTVPTQTLQKGKYTRFFPVVFVRRPSAIAPAEFPFGSNAFSAAFLPLDVFLGVNKGGVGGGGGGAARLHTTDATSDSQSGALLRTFKLNDRIR